MADRPMVEDLPLHVTGLRRYALALTGSRCEAEDRGHLLAGDDRPVAQLIYEDASGYRLSLSLSSAPADGGPEMEVVQVGGLTAGYWHEGDLTYALVGGASEQQLLAVGMQFGAEQPQG